MLRPVTLQFDLIEPCSEASAAAVARRVGSVATEGYRKFLGQDLHLLDDDAFHGAPHRLRSSRGEAAGSRAGPMAVLASLRNDGRNTN